MQHAPERFPLQDKETSKPRRIATTKQKKGNRDQRGSRTPRPRQYVPSYQLSYYVRARRSIIAFSCARRRTRFRYGTVRSAGAKSKEEGEGSQSLEACLRHAPCLVYLATLTLGVGWQCSSGFCAKQKGWPGCLTGD